MTSRVDPCDSEHRTGGMLVVAALGGNALVRSGEHVDAETQHRNVKQAADAVAEIARGHQLVVTHGNGPQIGLLALQSEALHDARTYPLDVLGAESEGMIGYLLEQELGNALPDRNVVSLLTQVVVDPLDPAFRTPTKPIGPAYTESEARELARQRGWNIASDDGSNKWRRVVASPAPRSIVEMPAIRLLLDASVIVVCAGGGGIPVVLGLDGARHGVEAVVDKDMSAALLARQLNADLLLLLTDVDAVEVGFGTPEARPMQSVTVSELRRHEFAPRSMGPKVDAASWFAATTGRPAAIGRLEAAASVLRGKAGTVVTPG